MDSETKQPRGTELGSLLRRLRKRQGLSQLALAEAAGTSGSYVGMVERGLDPGTGQPPNPSAQVLQAWGRVLGDDDREREENAARLLVLGGYLPPEGAPLKSQRTGTRTEPADARLKSGDAATGEPSEEMVQKIVRMTLKELQEFDPRLFPVRAIPRADQRVPASEQWPVEAEYPESQRVEHLVQLQVRGDCMEPSLRDGMWAIVDSELRHELGDILVVYWQGDWTMKRLRRRNGVYLLVPDNPMYEPIEVDPTHTRVLGVVVDARLGRKP